MPEPNNRVNHGRTAWRQLGRWYRAHGRHDLPWRLTRDRYAVLVSEVMLQQTQVERVLPYWKAWMDRWPAAGELAASPTAEVIRAWAGLGYNRRAVNLQRATVEAIERWGRLPGRPALLETLPGIGRYTANAVSCFADGRRVTVLDTNISRVIARAALGAASGKAAGARAVDDAALGLLPARGARDWNLALMDLGAMVCTARTPDCGSCPLQTKCAWMAAGYPLDAPRPAMPSKRFEETARFARGRIVEFLRERWGSDEATLAAILPGAHRARLTEYLRGLERDGLAARGSDGSWGLPGEDQGRISIASPKL